MEWKQFFNKNKKIILIIFIILASILMIAAYLIIDHKNKKRQQLEQKNYKKVEQVIEKEVNFNQLKNHIDDLKNKYSSSTKLYKGLNINEYYSNPEDINNAYALICINGGYNISSKIKSPILIFIPNLKLEDKLQNDNRCYDVTLEDLKQYCNNKQQPIYIYHILDLPSNTSSKTESSPLDVNKLQNNNVKEILVDTLDDLFTNDFFKTLEKKIISIGCLADLSDTDPLNKSCDTILIVKEDQQNSIPKLDDRKMLIYIELTDEEKNNHKYKETEDKPNEIFNKKYNNLTLEDIKKINNRNIYIFKIKFYDYKDVEHNPLSETKMN
ncbi:MAG: hypothetical protein ACN23H_01080 [Candidatus Phytoplasma vitis]|nr:MAG: hypothetical protein M6G77_00955 [Candidatus Phytoplasma vitis]